MTIEQLQKDMVAAMKTGNKEKKAVISDFISCAKNMAIAKKCKDNITEDIVMEAIMRTKKICQEQIDTCPAERVEALAAFKQAMVYIDEYAPKMMTREEIKDAFYKCFTLENGEITIPTNKGIVMKTFMPIVKGKADGKLVNEVIEEILKPYN